MKKKLLRIGQALAFILVLTIAIHGVYNALKWKDTSGDYISVMEQLYSTPKNLVDVVFMGSSHCYCGIYPSVLWEDAGIASFDMSVSGQDLSSTYHDLKELLKTQRPSVVMVDCYGLLFDVSEVESNDYRNYISMDFSLNSIEHINSYRDKDKIKDFMARFPIIHTRYKELRRKDFESYSPNQFGRGERAYFVTEEVSFDQNVINDETVGSITKEHEMWLEKMKKLSQDYGFTLELMLIPNVIPKDMQERVNAFSQYCQKNGIAFTNYNSMLKELGIDSKTDFIDPAHLNAYGARKFTRFLEGKLLEEYNIEGHADDERYYQWDMDSQWCQLLENQYVMTRTNDASEFVNAMVKVPNQYTVISVEIDATHDVSYYDALKVLGMESDDYERGGIWIYHDGELKKICEKQVGAEEYVINLSKYDTLKIGYYGPYEPGNIILNRKDCQTGFDVSFLTYSNLLGEIIAHRGF